MGHSEESVVLTRGDRDPQVVSGATARICTKQGNHKGQGLVLALRDGLFVLTCHHVIAGVPPNGVRVALPDDGGLGPLLPATFVKSRSRPERDAAVLRIAADLPARRPVLQALDPAAYGGSLPERATGYTYMAPRNFDARVATATRLELPVKRDYKWHDPPTQYVIPYAFRLADPTDSRPGVSGAVVAYEGGVLGLAHFGRGAGRTYEREVYLVPISTWAEGWEELGRLIEPFVDERLWEAATVRRVRDITVGIDDPSATHAPDLVIAEYREDIYASRPQVDMAQQALAKKALVLIGKPKSGKTRLAWELLREHPDAVLVMPQDPAPPAQFETAGLNGREIVVLCDDLHSVAEQLQPLRWRNRFRRVASAVSVVATARDGLEWRRVRDHQTAFLDAIDMHARVYLSETSEGGEDLPVEVARALAVQYGLTDTQFTERFDGTPGSLTLNLDDMTLRYQRLRDERLGEVQASRLLDCLKLLNLAEQSHLGEHLARAVAEQIRGDGPLAAETWDGLCRRTREEGFGAFSADGEFLTYRPYLERCVEYTPTRTELDRLAALLRERGESERLVQLDVALDQHDARLAGCIDSLTALAVLSENLQLRWEAPGLWPLAAASLWTRVAAVEDQLASLPRSDNLRVAVEFDEAHGNMRQAAVHFREATRYPSYLDPVPLSLHELPAVLGTIQHNQRTLRQAIERLKAVLAWMSEHDEAQS